MATLEACGAVKRNIYEMKPEVSTNKEPVFIGKIIEEELRRQKRSVTWLSNTIHSDRRNIYDIFSRKSIDTGLLLKISIALDFDFFKAYSRFMESTN